MPFYLSLFSFLASLIWMIYGILGRDPYITVSMQSVFTIRSLFFTIKIKLLLKPDYRLHTLKLNIFFFLSYTRELCVISLKRKIKRYKSEGSKAPPPPPTPTPLPPRTHTHSQYSTLKTEYLWPSNYETIYLWPSTFSDMLRSPKNS